MSLIASLSGACWIRLRWADAGGSRCRSEGMVRTSDKNDSQWRKPFRINRANGGEPLRRSPDQLAESRRLWKVRPRSIPTRYPQLVTGGRRT